MGFRTGAFAKVWEVTPKTDRVTQLRISVSRKDKQTGNYVTDFAGYAAVYGDAAIDAARLKQGDSIQLGEVDVGTYKNDQGKYFTNFKIFGFQLANRAPSGGQAGQGQQQRGRQSAPPRQGQQRQPVNSGYSSYGNRGKPPVDEASEEFAAGDGFPF